MAVGWRAEQILELAVSAVKGGDFERAAHLCLQAIKVKPDFAEAFHIRGICCLRQQRPFDALLHFEAALATKPEMADCWNNRGIAFADIGMWDSARESFQRSLSLARTSEPHVMCGGMFAHLMQLEAAENEFKAALEIDPNLQDARVKLGVIQLGMGKWREGFANYFWRWFDTPYPPRPFRSFPMWDGQNVTQKSLLLYSEQGYGDEIMSLRFVHDVIAMAVPEHVTLEVRPTMYRLASASFANLGVRVIASGDPYPAGIDFSCPLLDVPRVLNLTPVDLGFAADRCGGPYLSVEKVGDPRVTLTGRFKVGLVWSSGRRPLQPETERSAVAKSVPLEMFRGIVATKGIDFYSLQLRNPEMDVIDPIPRDMPVKDMAHAIDDLWDTAQIIADLDLVISVDTAVAHLAGAMGRPVWNLVRLNGYWPWMQPPGRIDGGEPTPWYRSMRLFRQPELGDWATPLAAIQKRLARTVDRSDDHSREEPASDEYDNEYDDFGDDE